MPWSNQSGGGGPRKPTNGPWGQGPSGGSGGGGSTPPDLEELLRRSQDRLRKILPGGSFTGRGVAIVVVIGVVIWALSGFYTVLPNEVGINFIFGRYIGKKGPGLNYNFPSPIGSYQKLAVTDRNSIDIGGVFQDSSQSGLSTASDRPEESLMLTSDENIADVKFRVIWQIDPVEPQDYLFNVRNPDDIVKAVAESSMREVVGHTAIQQLLTKRVDIGPKAEELMQGILTSYKAGVKIVQVQLLPVDPPQSVIASFLDVTAAQQDLQRMRNEAETYANQVVPEARGAAARIIQEAEGYRLQSVAEAKGQVARYNLIYDAYKKAPAVTRQRLYIEMWEKVLSGADKLIIDEKNGGAGVVPYLPLGELKRQQGAAQ